MAFHPAPPAGKCRRAGPSAGHHDDGSMTSSIHTIQTIHTIRERVLQIHRWTGITIGLLVVLVATTGAAMVFRPQLDPVINRSLLKVEPCSARLPLDTLVANARAANPGGGALTFMRIYGE